MLKNMLHRSVEYQSGGVESSAQLYKVAKLYQDGIREPKNYVDVYDVVEVLEVPAQRHGDHAES